MQIPLAAVGEWITVREREEAGTREEVTVTIQEYIGGSLDSSGGTVGGGEVDTFGLHFGGGVTDRLDVGMELPK